MVKTKAISEPAEASDGLRFFIVRYTINIGRNQYFQWIPEVSPSVELLKLWKSRRITWKAFVQKYIQEISTIPEAQKKIHELKELVKLGQQITLLCFESEWRHDCHRHILKEIILETETEAKAKADSHRNMPSNELLSYIPRQKSKEKQAVLELEHQKITAELPKHCYYCDNNKYTNKEEYQKHVLLKHSGKLCYPGLSDLKLLGIKAQSMPWEI